jgi:hypothetical protein
VTLVRDRRRSTFDLKLREDDIATNQAIQERLKTDFGITLPEISEDESWRPSDYFTEVQMAIAAKTRWRLDENGAELGFYSFSKLLMIRDLEPDNWTEKVILEHPLLRGLLVEGFASEPPIIADGAKLDQLFAPADLIHRSVLHQSHTSHSLTHRVRLRRSFNEMADLPSQAWRRPLC